MTETRVILCCAGSQERWGNYLGCPKHLVPVNGIPLLTRTVNQLVDKGFEDIITVAFDKKYETSGATLCSPTSTVLVNTGIGHSAEFWSTTGTTIILLGDVYFSDDAMNIISNYSKEDMNWFGRLGAGKSGHRYGELFGLSLPLKQQEKLRKIIERLNLLRDKKIIKRAGGWECYRQLHNTPVRFYRNPLKPNEIGSDFFEIDDSTEDFDRPEEYNEWCKVFGDKNEK